MKPEKPKLPAVRPGAAYEVGYARPPASGQFQPGKSGNPKGRPRGAKNKRPALNEERLKGIILDEAYREITVRDGDRNVSVPMAQAIVRALAVNAAKGHHRAQRLFAEMLSATEAQNKALADAWLETAIEYKVSWERELHRREVMGITHLPPPLPHPDQVKIDMNTGAAWIKGPATKEQVEQLELWIKRRDDWQEELESQLELLTTETDPETRKFIEDDIVHSRKILAMVDVALGKIGY